MNEVISVYAGPKGRTIVFTETKKEANELAMSPELKIGTLALLSLVLPGFPSFC
jgi:hypothetical protein